ncbi:MAG TPA: hypothetical protein VGC59_13410 [Solirubrobacteraceae bacterium]|jgi:hypothetical protein
MSPREYARVLNVGRIALGLSLLLAPRLSARAWIGADAARPGTATVARAHGVRDAVLGVIALQTIDDPLYGPRCQRLAGLCDAVDLGATVAARRSLPPTGALVGLLAAAGLVGQLWVAAELAAGQPSAD